MATKADRDPQTGRFVTGNPGGPGNPHAQRVAALRSALLEAVTPADMVAVAKQLIRAARGGDVAAMKVFFERTLGRPLEADILDRLEALEQAIEGGPQ
jgi:carbamoylphosphate synthase small subunit